MWKVVIGLIGDQNHNLPAEASLTRYKTQPIERGKFQYFATYQREINFPMSKKQKQIKIVVRKFTTGTSCAQSQLTEYFRSSFFMIHH